MRPVLLFDESDIDRVGAKGILGAGTRKLRGGIPVNLAGSSPEPGAGLMLRHNKTSPEDNAS